MLVDRRIRIDTSSQIFGCFRKTYAVERGLHVADWVRGSVSLLDGLDAGRRVLVGDGWMMDVSSNLLSNSKP